jgi:hypothetical protein
MILDQHPLVYHAGETFFWARLTPDKVRCSCGNEPCSTLTNVYEAIRNYDQELHLFFKTCSMLARAHAESNSAMTFSVAGFDDHYPDAEWVKLDQYVDSACNTLDILCSQYRKIVGNPIIVDNSKAIGLAPALLTRCNWKIILLTRDVRGLVSSIKHLNQRKGKAPCGVESLLTEYIEFAERAVELLAREDQTVHWVRYEDLCSRPRAVVQGVCRFLGIDFQESMLEFKSNRGHMLMGNRMRFDDNQTIAEDLSWQVRLTADEQSLIGNNDTLQTLYRTLGYQM